MSPAARLILALLADKPMHTPGLCRSLDRDYAATVPLMTALKRNGLIEIVGKAADFGFTDVASTAPVYGRTGKAVQEVSPMAKRLPAIVLPPKTPRRARTSSGSGQIAGKITIGRGYNWRAGLV